MRILQVTPHYFPQRGGVERHVQAISEGLAARGHTVAVITMAAPGHPAAVELVNGVPVHRLPALGPAPAYRVPMALLSCLAGGEQFDIVHAHNYHAPMLPLAAAAAAGRLVVTPHLNDRPHSRAAGLLHRPYSLVGRWALRRARAVVCVSPAEQARLTARFGLPAAATTVIPNGVDLGAVARERPAPRDPRLLLAVGRLESYKRADRAIAALAALPSDYRLVIVGEGPRRAALLAQAHSLGVAERVHLAGAVDDATLADWYRRAAVALNMSEAEAFGITVLEALARGCRVVSSAIPAFCDLARSFPAQITPVPADSPAAVAAAVLAAAQSPAPAAADLSAFSWDSVVERLLALYEGLSEQPELRFHRYAEASA